MKFLLIWLVIVWLVFLSTEMVKIASDLLNRPKVLSVASKISNWAMGSYIIILFSIVSLLAAKFSVLL